MKRLMPDADVDYSMANSVAVKSVGSAEKEPEMEKALVLVPSVLVVSVRDDSCRR